MPILGLKQGLPPVVLLGLLPVLGLVAEEGLTLGSAASLSFCSIFKWGLEIGSEINKRYFSNLNLYTKNYQQAGM